MSGPQYKYSPARLESQSLDHMLIDWLLKSKTQRWSAGFSVYGIWVLKFVTIQLQAFYPQNDTFHALEVHVHKYSSDTW